MELHVQSNHVNTMYKDTEGFIKNKRSEWNNEK